MDTKFFNEIISLLKRKKMSKEELQKKKAQLCIKYKTKKVPTDIDILMHASKEDIPKLRKILLTKPTRTLSGVAVIAVMTYPFECPHGVCIYCPGGPKSEFGDVPQSYTGREPATMRGMRAGFDPYIQVFNRLEQYVVTGHNPEKAELIVMGGTFPSFPKKYKEDFITYCFKAMNDFSKLFYRKGELDFDKFRQFFELPGKVGDPKRTKKIHQKLKKLRRKAKLETEQKKNEKADIRCVGLTIETRPDYATLKHGNEMLKLGCTRVELGIQSIYDDVLKKIERGHDVKESVNATRILKDLGFKINYHYMLGLPGSSMARDLKGLKELFSDSRFKPDMLKIYPTMVVKGTKLYNIWKKGKYSALDAKKAANIIAEFKKIVPTYCRIMRIQRDIPTFVTEAGVERTNLRQYVEQLTKKKKIICKCIRCREIGRQLKPGKIELKIVEYDASEGKEFFISAESRTTLTGFCRLRFPNKSIRKDITDKSAIIRELHVYGTAAAIGGKAKVQHKGFGKKLLKKAESIAKKNGKNKIVVISGVGVREYYRKFGYKKQGPYMVKTI